MYGDGFFLQVMHTPGLVEGILSGSSGSRRRRREVTLTCPDNQGPVGKGKKNFIKATLYTQAISASVDFS